MTEPKTYRVVIGKRDGKLVLDPTHFATRKAAQNRIGAYMVRDGCRIIVQKPNGNYYNL